MEFVWRGRQSDVILRRPISLSVRLKPHSIVGVGITPPSRVCSVYTYSKPDTCMIWTHTRCSCAVVVIIPAPQNMHFVMRISVDIRRYDSLSQTTYQNIRYIRQNNVISKKEDCGRKTSLLLSQYYIYFFFNKTEVIITNESKIHFFSYQILSAGTRCVIHLVNMSIKNKYIPGINVKTTSNISCCPINE